jgi:hypothetical protein
LVNLHGHFFILLSKLFEEAAKKAASIPRQPFKENWPDLQAMLRLIRAQHYSKYLAVKMLSPWLSIFIELASPGN